MANKCMDCVEFSCIAFCVCFILIASIVSIIEGFVDLTDECTNEDAIGISLGSWLVGAGIYVLCFGLSSICVIQLNGAKEMYGQEIPLKWFFILHIIFTIIYTIIGTVILFRSNFECFKSGNAVGVLSLMDIILYWISLIGIAVYKIK